MKEAGIEWVVAPALESFGGNTLLRVVVYDLETENLAFSTHLPLDKQLEAALARELGSEGGLQPVRELRPAGKSPAR